MSIDTNLSIYGGRLVRDPEEIGDGKGCRFSVASNRYYKDGSGDRQKDTTFMTVVAWASLADLIMGRCKKGSSVLVEGRLENRSYEDGDGTKKRFVNIIARDVRFIDNPESERRSSDSELSGTSDEVPESMDEASYKAFQALMGGAGK